MFRFRRYFFVSSATLCAGFTMLAPGRAWAGPDPTEPTTTVAEASPSASIGHSCLASPPFVEYWIQIDNPTSSVLQFEIVVNEEFGSQDTIEILDPYSSIYVLRYPTSDGGSGVTVRSNGTSYASASVSAGSCGPAPIDPATATITPMCGSDGGALYLVDMHNPTPYDVVFTMTLVDETGPDTSSMSVPAGTDSDFQYGTSYDSGSTMEVEVAGTVLATASQAAGDCATAPDTTAPDTTAQPTTTELVATTDEDPTTTTPTSEPVTMQEEPSGDPSTTMPPTTAPTTSTDMPTVTTPPTDGSSTQLEEQPIEPQRLPETGSSSVIITALAGALSVLGVVLRLLAGRR